MKKEILVATHNQAKFKEISKMIGQKGYAPISLKDLGITKDIPETGKTLAENALLKAQGYFNLTGIPTIADDTGLEVEALGGEPGIYSARYAGIEATDEELLNYLLNKMKAVPFEKRKASFTTIIAFVYAPEKVTYYEGTLSGIILTTICYPIKKGIPYCSVFYLPEIGKTLGEWKEDPKENIVTHRMQAIQKFLKDLD